MDLVEYTSYFKAFILARWRFVKLQELISQDRVAFLSMLLCYLFTINLKRDEKGVNYNMFACVAEVNSKDQAEIRSGGQP